ncbi:hypothetical protein BDV27DRAFT_143984 [Aspergillus caelatus]|uniref:Uncharacterized protein n=2 Tax=Aspergillus subgen. Circumdati TaxID=2720871 RepID=A0A5N7A8A4_9EURO|nr:uncharacterized protein BDV27DRAFT_143984 [Aspergillus caelatus]KAE8365935.1 hypothetical protein BDV27DRAFT_143984 [Aspergillus caelatus]KAE8416039.1 hypothetical protein BDV36DRAFT_284910 [Aspergillus pseudocaelatus]
MSPPNPPIQSSVAELFHTIETSFQSTSLGPDSWYLLTIACLSGSPDPELAKELYLYVIQKEENSNPAARQAFVRRIREALVKCVSIVGCCKPIEAIIAISQVEQEEDRDYSLTREDWQCDQANHERGMRCIMIQNLKKETHWHIRGTRRIGVSKEDTQVLWDCIQRVARFFGMRMNKVPTVDEVEYDV